MEAVGGDTKGLADKDMIDKMIRIELGFDCHLFFNHSSASDRFQDIRGPSDLVGLKVKPLK